MRDDLRRKISAAQFCRRSYRPGRWFWIVGDHPDTVFSSEVGGYLDQRDPNFVKFASDGKKATRILSGAELADVLREAGMPDTIVRAAGTIKD